VTKIVTSIRTQFGVGLRRSLKKKESKWRKGGAFPHCAAAEPHWFIDWGTIGKALPHCAAAELLWFIELGVGKVRCYVRKNS